MSAEFTSRYRLEEQIGEGGMGIVYRASDLRLFEKTVALKMIRPDKAADPMLRKRLDIEARAAATLNHPAIAMLLDFEANGETPFLIYEFVSGRTLRAIEEERAIPLREVLAIFIALAEGLAVAHDAGIVHRDLKPENVMLTNERQVKILDFGLAKVLPRTGDLYSTQSRGTLHGGVVGTIGYMSPEQIESDPVDHRTDIFTLGIMLYEFALKQHPFKGKTGPSTLSNILKDEPRNLASVDGMGIIPTDLTRVIRKSLRKKREERYQSMRDLAVDLNDVLREHVAPSPAPGPAPAHFVIPHAWPKFMLVQGVYVTIYVAALIYAPNMKPEIWEPFRVPESVGFLMMLFLAMCGLVLRVWTISSVGHRHPDAGRQFNQLFPLLFLVDEVWAASPLLLLHKWGGYGFLTLGCVAAMAYLPFTQKTLMESIYPGIPAGVPSSEY